jgi:hypothetical protein
MLSKTYADIKEERDLYLYICLNIRLLPVLR